MELPETSLLLQPTKTQMSAHIPRVATFSLVRVLSHSDVHIFHIRPLFRSPLDKYTSLLIQSDGSPGLSQTSAVIRPLPLPAFRSSS